MEQFSTGIVRIRSTQRLIVGAGFLYADRRILTCCHVVDQALNLSASSEMPEDDVNLDFPFIDRQQIYVAKIVQWFPKQQDTGDVAVLELQGHLPNSAVQFPFVSSETFANHRVRTFGFPAGFEEAGQIVLAIAQGKLANGQLSIHAESDYGIWIEGGFSGAPVWDHQLNGVIGMVTSVDGGIKRSASVILNTMIQEHGIALQVTNASTYHSQDDPVVIAPPTQTTATFHITGQNPTVINAQHIESLIIKPGDSSEEKERKTVQIARVTVSELLNVVRSIDSRLALLTTLDSEDVFGQQLDDVRQRIVPSIAEIASSGYKQLMIRQQVASLRAAFNAYPLPHNANESLIQLAPEVDIPVEDLQFFYTQVREVIWATDSLFTVMDELAATDAAQTNWIDYLRARLKLAMETLHNRSSLAYMVALKTLTLMVNAKTTLSVSLQGLTQLKPDHLIEHAEFVNLYTQHIEVGEQLHHRRAELVELGKSLLNSSLANYEQIEQLLTINPNDEWHVVVGKGVSLRQFGRTSDAIAAFRQYSAMFQLTDPHAAKYAAIAEQFTAAFEQLGIKDGAVYVFDVADGSPAANAGIREGDIITHFDDQLISNMVMMQEHLARLVDDKVVNIRVLRLDETGNFSDFAVQIVVQKPLGVSLMPI